jgi:hypothetical protein
MKVKGYMYPQMKKPVGMLYTTLQHHCTTFGFASGYTEVLQGGTISMPTGRHVDNLYCTTIL